MYDNAIKIRCNPYTKVINYLYLEESGEWSPASSKLASDAFTNITIQHKLHEIIEEINEKYNLGNNGLDIIFEGCREDLEDLRSEVEQYFSEYKLEVKEGDYVIDSASEVMPEINRIFSDIKESFKEYPDDDISAEIMKFNETVKPVVSICVMGLYSSGKSAFINSLLGAEILPSASDPMTAKNYKINSSNAYKVRFLYDNQRIEIKFKGKKITINKPGELEIVQRLQQEIDEIEHGNEACRLYKALSIINGYEDSETEDTHISTLIEVWAPFRNSRLPLDKFDFSIYDTPGSDSVHSDHLLILKDSLQGQTNGLPIFVTTPDEMDKEKNNEIIKIIEEMGEALDQTSTIVIVNKSDEKDEDVLKEKKTKCDKLRVTKWHSSRVLFVSSILGLGSKKKNPLDKVGWTDRQYFKIFYQQKSCFSDEQDPFYMQLYKYNFLPQRRSDEVTKEAMNLTDESEVIYYNSGLATVEEEISIFAYKYALYNKCKQAREYLQHAIALVVGKVKETEECMQDTEHQINNDIDEKKRELINTLTEEGNKRISAINKKFADEIVEKVDEIFKPDKEKELLATSWSEIVDYTKKNKKKDEQVHMMEKRVDEHFARFYGKLKREVDTWTRLYWENAEKEYKEACCKVISKSGLSEAQKQFLNSYIMDTVGIEVKENKIDMRKDHIVVDKKFLWFTVGKKFVLENCQNAYVKAINTSILTMNQKAVADNEKQFRDWSVALQTGIKSKITELNPELIGLANQLEQCRSDIKALNKQCNLLTEKQEHLESILDFHVKEVM